MFLFKPHQNISWVMGTRSKSYHEWWCWRKSIWWAMGTSHLSPFRILAPTQHQWFPAFESQLGSCMILRSWGTSSSATSIPGKLGTFSMAKGQQYSARLPSASWAWARVWWAERRCFRDLHPCTGSKGDFFRFRAASVLFYNRLA